MLVGKTGISVLFCLYDMLMGDMKESGAASDFIRVLICYTRNETERSERHSISRGGMRRGALLCIAAITAKYDILSCRTIPANSHFLIAGSHLIRPIPLPSDTNGLLSLFST